MASRRPLADRPIFADGPILKASTVQLRGTDPLTLTVAERVAKASEEAYRAGFEEGFTAGGLHAGSALLELGETLRASVTEELTRHLRTVRDNREDEARRLSGLALAVAEWVVRRELSAVPDAFFARLSEILADRDRRQSVQISTSTALAEPTRQWLDDPAIVVIADEDLHDGEARVSLGDTTVFATFTDAFERARDLLDELDVEQLHAFDGRPLAPPAPDDQDGDDEEIVEVLYDATAPHRNGVSP